MNSDRVMSSNARAVSSEVSSDTAKSSSNTFYGEQNDALADKIFTHGYVHGHIHKHKDHTHIHGHIHNHDHDHHGAPNVKNESVAQEGIMSNTFLEDCKKFDELAYCDEIFCDDLDDCFFFNCEDTKKSNHSACDVDCDSEGEVCDDPHHFNTQDILCCSDSKCYELSSSSPSTAPTDGITCCEDESCLDEHNFCPDDIPESHLRDTYTCCNSHDKSCVDINEANEQSSKRPIFENLITNVHQNLTQLPELAGQRDKSQENQKQMNKRRKIDKDFEIHFPPSCHQISMECQPKAPKSSASTTINTSIPSQVGISNEPLNSSNSTHTRQSCFHTTIPNAEPGTFSSNAEDLMFDFDFYAQFDTFSQLMNNQLSKRNQNQQASHDSKVIKSESTSGSTVLPEKNHYLPSQSHLSRVPIALSPKTTYSCQWDSCHHAVTDSTLLEHLMDQHIPRIEPMSINPKATYHCEWNDCKHIDDNLDSLIDHLNVHREDHSLYSSYEKPNQILSDSQSQVLLTPSSTVPSPLINDDNGQGTVKSDSKETKLNISDIKIMPRKTHCKHSTNSIKSERPQSLTCQWQVGVDAEGVPIPCGKEHSCEGDLQTHLIEGHIGSGKSVYQCDWIGCERHNGKLFNQRQKLLRHIHTHTNYKPCKCEVCGACFAVESILKQHLRTHSGEKPFCCSICGKHFTTSSSLSIHKRVHSGIKPLECKWPGCNKRFRESSNLAKHMKTHMKSFVCDLCGEEFDKKPSLTRHMKSHKKGEEPSLLGESYKSNAKPEVKTEVLI